MKVIIVEDIGSAYRLNDGVLEVSYLLKGDSIIFDMDDFSPIDEELVGDEEVEVDGKLITLSEVYEEVTKLLKGE